MAKSTRQGDSYTERELADPVPPVVITRAGLRGEKGWTETAGTASSESSKRTDDSETSQPTNPPSNVPPTANPSQPEQTESGDAPLITTSGLEQEEVEPYTEWPYAELQAECKARDLKAGGSTEDLIARLEEWDETHATDD